MKMGWIYRKYTKEEFEFASYRKKIDILVMLFLFALALGLFITGLVATGTKKNLLTVVAVLGLLPACKQLVAVIMSLRVKVCDIDTRRDIDEHIGMLYGVYNPYFTSYDKNFPFAHLVITKNSIIALDADNKVNPAQFNEHIQDLLRKEGIKDVLIKVFDNKDKYIKRLDELNAIEGGPGVSEAIAKLVYDVTL